MYRILIPLPTHTDNIQHGSGTFASIYRNMAEAFELCPVGPFEMNKSLWPAAFNRLHRYGLFPWKFPLEHRWDIVNAYAQQLQRSLKNYRYDAIFTTSTLLAAGIKTDKPIFAYTDFSFCNALDYYEFASDLFPPARKKALELDKFCFQQYTKVFLASDWAKRETEKAYQLNSDKIVSIGRGANLVAGYTEDDAAHIIKKRVAADCRNFLFVGISWNRKGGNTAYEIVKNLRNQGMNVQLQIVGCTPPPDIIKEDFVQVYPYLNRNDKAELEVLKALFENAWLFMLPTKAEAMGIVFAEAASFALPAVSYNTGGVSTAVENNKTGLLFNLADSTAAMTERITGLMHDENQYRQLCRNAFTKYRTELNWKTIIQNIKKEMVPYMQTKLVHQAVS